MAIPDHVRTNFQTLLRAAASGELALIECTDNISAEPRYVLCAIAFDPAPDAFILTPFGHLAADDPYQLYVPPEVVPGT
jgi:hypothetical protein